MNAQQTMRLQELSAIMKLNGYERDDKHSYDHGTTFIIDAVTIVFVRWDAGRGRGNATFRASDELRRDNDIWLNDDAYCSISFNNEKPVQRIASDIKRMIASPEAVKARESIHQAIDQLKKQKRMVNSRETFLQCIGWEVPNGKSAYDRDLSRFCFSGGELRSRSDSKGIEISIQEMGEQTYLELIKRITEVTKEVLGASN